jgi:hypothetical protein
MVKYCEILKKIYVYNLSFQGRKQAKYPDKNEYDDMVITTLKQILKNCEIGWSVAIVHTMNFESMYLFIKTNKIHAIKYI